MQGEDTNDTRTALGMVDLPGRPWHRTPREGFGSLSIKPVGYTPWCLPDVCLAAATRRIDQFFASIIYSKNEFDHIQCNLAAVLLTMTFEMICSTIVFHMENALAYHHPDPGWIARSHSLYNSS